jgi:hypothetical protein
MLSEHAKHASPRSTFLVTFSDDAIAKAHDRLTGLWRSIYPDSNDPRFVVRQPRFIVDHGPSNSVLRPSSLTITDLPRNLRNRDRRHPGALESDTPTGEALERLIAHDPPPLQLLRDDARRAGPGHGILHEITLLHGDSNCELRNALRERRAVRNPADGAFGLVERQPL